MTLFLLLIVITQPIWAVNEIPAGWNRTIDNRKNAIVFKPSNTNIDVMVKYYPTELLEGASVNVWLQNKLSNSKAPMGKWSEEPNQVVRESYNRAYSGRTFRKPDGSIGNLGAVAFSADLLYVRLAVIIYDKNKTNETYRKQAFAILRNIDKVEIANAKEEWRGLDLETGAPKVTGVKKGGPIKPGRYVGSKTISGEVRGQYTIILYETGEYEFPNTKKKHSGYYRYSKGFGKLYIKDPCSNTLDTWENHYCVYGTNEKTGKPVIYAYDSPAHYRLNWVGPVDRLSPRQRQEIEAKEKAKERSYQYTTNPGDGLSIDQIETILYVYQEHNESGEGVIDEEIYLLTKDGRVMDGLPVAPNMLDITKSQNREPDRWGWWKFDGQNYRFAWVVDKKHYVIPKGKQIKSKPIPAGTHLKGDWNRTNTYTGSDFTSSNSRGGILNKDGRFVHYSKDVVQVNGSNLGRESQHEPDHDEMGLYEFEGYNLTLKYDNGDVHYLPTFTTDEEFEHIWFRNSLLHRR
jgi:hypothetical protein